MFRPLEIYIGLRYTRAKRRNHFVSFISLTSMVGIALGVMALITVLSVMNGFEGQLRERILGMVAHATITGVGDNPKEWQAIVAKAEAQPHVLGAAPFVNGEVMLTNAGRVAGSVIRGVLPEYERRVSNVADKMIAGRLDDLAAGEFGIVLGKELADLLGVRLGDKITMVTPDAQISAAGVLPRIKRFTVVGVFQVGMYEYDRVQAFVHMDDAAKLFRTEGGLSGIRLKFDDLMAAPWLAREVAMELPGYYRVRDWTLQHYNFFKAVRTEKTVMFVILTLIVAVAAFNIVAMLVMVVTDKRTDIAILRTLGASPRRVMGVFITQGLVIGWLGVALGVALGVLLAQNVDTIVPVLERTFGFQIMDADVYYITRIPSDLHWSNVAWISVAALVLTSLATVYPALRAAGTPPADALRYE